MEQNSSENIVDPDVMVILYKDDEIINGSAGVISGMSAKLGVGKMGLMVLGKD